MLGKWWIEKVFFFLLFLQEIRTAVLPKLSICWTDFVVIARSELDDNAKVHRSLDKAQLFAYHLEQNWNLGGCDEDIIILFSREDNVVCIFFLNVT